MSRKTRPVLQLDAQGRWLPSSNDYTTVRLDYSGSNPIYVGQARPGTAEATSAWQIVQLNYSGTNLISTLYPTNIAGDITADFEFSWTGRAGYTYA